jgi:hypothetical protein
MKYDINEVINNAKALEIKITNANLGTELCECWIDRVMDAKRAWDCGDMTECQALINDANRYAV